MSGGWRGLLGAWLALAALQAIGSSPAATGRVGGALSGVAGLVRRALDPTVPAIPDLRPGRDRNAPASLASPPASAPTTTPAVGPPPAGSQAPQPTPPPPPATPRLPYLTA